jgi:N-acetylglutamate synthase-like GNAT family acetyltransferase
LAGFNERPYELNEFGWWSGWTQATWLSKDAYAMFSKDFDENFFNRAGFVRVSSGDEQSLDAIEGEFTKHRRIPHIFVQSNSNHPALLRALAERSYRISDQMSVMEIETPLFKVNPELTLEMGVDSKLEEWASVYLSAFYGETGHLKAVTRILQEVSRMKETSLVLASLKKKPVGCLALFRSKGVCGVYCVGTHPSVRGVGVASTMLDFSRKVAVGEGRRLILQTILSDAVEHFYWKLGFRRVYLKDLFVKDSRRVPG